ncbi:hypothetical protein AM571_PC00460 (plasmid) [Rhizobium etli 8C-3]|uniref:Uncharacterized protein n=1 Tax=Rhizobium etli 8C-3 TaxID=538025 RepID=A0A1L5PDD2_RHIET|nr:hypothetical protein AM571_PC00460 [Rhizobium etli 8C-3]
MRTLTAGTGVACCGTKPATSALTGTFHIRRRSRRRIGVQRSVENAQRKRAHTARLRVFGLGRAKPRKLTTIWTPLFLELCMIEQMLKDFLATWSLD